MSGVVFLLVLTAALLHAVWNALVKGGTDKGVAMAAVVIGQGITAAAVLPFVPAPAVECWPYLLLGIALHLGYQAFLLAAYRIGDLTQVYPIARGVAPLLVVAYSVLVLGVVLSGLEILAVAVIACGIMSLSLVVRGDGGGDKKAALLAVITGCFIASYSITDGIGARVAGTPLGYYGWVALGNAALFSAFMRVRSPGLITGAFRAWRVLVIGGGASFIAYGLVVYAFTVAPIALVTALRETSIVFALLIGVVALKEPLKLMKVVSTMLTLFGAALLRLSKG
ncbi:MAG: EamA family transporter [Pikeienuella sp.]